MLSTLAAENALQVICVPVAITAPEFVFQTITFSYGSSMSTLYQSDKPLGAGNRAFEVAQTDLVRRVVQTAWQT